jgi:hypothetical protein
MLVNFHVTNVPSYTGIHAKTRGLMHPQLPDTDMNSGPPDGARAVHHWADELLLQQNSVPDGETTHVSERTQRS